MIRSVVVAALFALTPLVAEAEGAPTPGNRWELDLFAGYGQLAWPSLDAGATRWSNGGFAFAASAAWRGQHFTHPFIDVAYVPFVASGQDVAASGGAPTYATASTHAWAFTVGPGFDVAWFRLRAGVGLNLVSSTVTVGGTSSSSTSPHLGYLVSVAGLVWRRDPFALGVEARLVALNAPGQGIYQTAWAAGLTGRWDFVRD